MDRNEAKVLMEGRAPQSSSATENGVKKAALISEVAAFLNQVAM